MRSASSGSNLNALSASSGSNLNALSASSGNGLVGVSEDGMAGVSGNRMAGVSGNGMSGLGGGRWGGGELEAGGVELGTRWDFTELDLQEAADVLERSGGGVEGEDLWAPPKAVVEEGVKVGSKKEEARKRACKRAHGEESKGRKRRKAGGKHSKVKQKKEKRALTLAQKREKKITGQSLGRARHVYKVVNGDWPLAPAMYLSDMRSPSMLRPVLLVKDPLNRYFESPHGNGKAEIMPDRVRNAELRRLLGLVEGEEPCQEDEEVQHLELVRMCESRWERCPMSYKGMRPCNFNKSNNERDVIIKEVLLDPINEMCRQLGKKEVEMYWVFHCPKEARGIGYYSGRWAANRSLQYTDDKLFMYAYKLFGEKYKKSTEGARPSEDTPPGRKIEFSWTDDSNVATEEVVTEKQLAKWEEVVKKRKGVIIRKGDCPTVRRKLVQEMQQIGGDWAFDVKPVRSVCLEQGRANEGQVANVRMSMLYYWPEDRIDFDDQDREECRRVLGSVWETMSSEQKKENLALQCYAARTGLQQQFPTRITPLGRDIWKESWEALDQPTKAMYAYKSVTQIGSLPILCETLAKHLIHPHLADPAMDHHVVNFIRCWNNLNHRLSPREHAFKACWSKIQPQLQHIANSSLLPPRRLGASGGAV